MGGRQTGISAPPPGPRSTGTLSMEIRPLRGRTSGPTDPPPAETATRSAPAIR